MTMTLRSAAIGDLGAICRLRRQRTAWLTAKGSDQWSVAGHGLPIEVFARAVGRAVEAGETWIVEVDGEAAGTITVNERTDPWLWSDAEVAGAVMVHYMIVDLRFAGFRLGHRLLSHAAAVACDLDREWVRLDAWTANTGLHDYYRRAGFRLARIAESAIGPSGALFERRTDSWDPTDRPRLPLRSDPSVATPV
ncbi:GNAT family N-acetyltransferase [Nocardia bovistercoris]|uniref:GNAT family N-acetyltransferase n=1 Tax=Nocardia bovistercoris TaxID=2785916 RepID=A0A931N369_9NOCA|nr:GNAT family N-acetyltransferase [Nocardia bovistercoris]MBH0777574.1 GNAT family N-acetyltransferase [Nocardia bovistercoris]